MPPLPPPAPSIKLTIEGLASLLGLKVCSHGDLGFAFGSGPVLASHEAAMLVREVVANLRTRAREEGEAAESLRAQLAETSGVLAEVTEILHRAWPEHMSGDPVQLAKMTAAAASRVTEAETIAAAGKRKAEEATRLEIAALREKLAELEYQRAEGRNRLATFLDAPTDESVDQLTSRIRDLLEIRDRYTAVKARAETDELEIKKLLESLRVAKSAESAKAEEVDALYKMIDTLAPKLPSCSEPHVDRLARAQRKIAAASLDSSPLRSAKGSPPSTREGSWQAEDPLELQEEPLRVSGNLRLALRRGSAQASGLDLPVRLGVSLAPGRTVRVPTGIKVAIPEGFEGQVRPRSSTAARGLLVHLGTIDADYRGEIDIVVTNLSGEWVAIDKPIAQLVICPTARPLIKYVEKLDETSRGEGGFGSSDIIASGGYVRAINIEATIGETK